MQLLHLAVFTLEVFCVQVRAETMGKLKKKETCWEDVLRDTWEKMKERERERKENTGPF